MPKGILYLKSSRTISPENSQDEKASDGWVDAFDTYGLSLSESGLSRLMTPAPNKQPVTNKNVLSPGESIVQNAFVKDVRTVSLEVHMFAGSTEQFLSNYAKLCDEIFGVGYFHLKTSYQEGVVYHFIYLDCTQFSEFNLEMAKMTLSLEEPRPDLRTGSVI